MLIWVVRLIFIGLVKMDTDLGKFFNKIWQNVIDKKSFKEIADINNANELLDKQDADLIAKSHYIEDLENEIINLKEVILSCQNTIDSLEGELLTKALVDSVSTVIGLYEKHELSPTQLNKPSAHSSLSDSRILSFLKPFRDAGGFRTFRVANTNSMEPFIDDNSTIITEKITDLVLSRQPLTKGDICIYDGQLNGRATMLIHRITRVRTEEKQYYFKGDNNFRGDGWVEMKDIKYRYVGQIQGKAKRLND